MVAPSQIPMNMEIMVCLVTKANTIVTSGGIRQSAVIYSLIAVCGSKGDGRKCANDYCD